jgi:hypothetical protein
VNNLKYFSIEQNAPGKANCTLTLRCTGRKKACAGEL